MPSRFVLLHQTYSIQSSYDRLVWKPDMGCLLATGGCALISAIQLSFRHPESRHDPETLRRLILVEAACPLFGGRIDKQTSFVRLGLPGSGMAAF